jgi:hypothetical protein
MQPFAYAMPTVTVSVIYCIYNAYMRLAQRKEQVLRERVSEMLWSVAMQM